MKPILFPPEEAATLLVDSNNVTLKDSANNDLYAIGEWYSARDLGTFGLGPLSDAIECFVTEERNGEYELQMVYPMDGALFDKIEVRGILVAQPGELAGYQPFRIYRISKPIGGDVVINARHISYDLTGVPVGLFSASSASGAVAGLMSHAALPNPFTIETDITTTAPFEVDEPTSIRSWFGGKEGSLIDVYGGEWKYTGYKCQLLSARGVDNGYSIRYGVNMMDFEQEENLANMWTGVLPYWKDPETGEVASGDIQYADGNFDFQRILSVDLTDEFDEAPLPSDLNARGGAYIKTNSIGIPEVNITVEFVPENIYGMSLCDTVEVVFEKIGVKATAKVVKTVYDVLKQRYETLQIGSVKPTIVDNIAELNKKVKIYGI